MNSMHSSSTHSSSTTAGTKRKAVEESSKNVTDCMKTFIDMCNKNEKDDTTSTVASSSSSVDTMSVDELYKLMDQQKIHLRFLKEMDALTDDDKKDTMEKIKQINNLIIGRAGITLNNNSINVSN